MENTVTIDMKNLSDPEREQLMKLVKKASNEEKKSKVWKPEESGLYYTILANGYVTIRYWNDDYCDKDSLSLGNVFRTREEAEEEVKRRKILTQWKRLSIEAGEEENVWNGKNLHFYPYFDRDLKILIISHYQTRISGIICFPSEESLKEAIQTIGEENVKKYILGVKE